MNIWTLRRNLRGPGFKCSWLKKVCERLNIWRRRRLFVTVKEHNEAVSELHKHFVAKVNAVAEREHEIFLREVRVVRAEVEMIHGQFTSYTLKVSNSLFVRRRDGQLDRQICETITRKMIDGLKWAANNRFMGLHGMKQY